MPKMAEIFDVFSSGNEFLTSSKKTPKQITVPVVTIRLSKAPIKTSHFQSKLRAIKESDLQVPGNYSYKSIKN